MKKEREYLTALMIEGGLINLIEPSGNIGVYRQRGIKRLGEQKIKVLINKGYLAANWELYKELPKNWSIYYEDEEIMGKARVTFKDPFK